MRSVLAASVSRNPASGRWDRRAVAYVSVALLVFAASGCTNAPVREFEGFSEAFEEVRAATYVLIDDYEAAIRPAESATSAKAPARFDPKEFRSLGGVSATDQRRRAVDAVVRYNELMRALAKGSGLESVKASLTPLAGLLGVSAPQLGVGGSFVEQLIGRALAARDNAQFVRAFRAATVAPDASGACATTSVSPADAVAPTGTSGDVGDASCMPIIEGIIEHLIADTPDYYDARRAQVNRRLAELADPVRESGRQMAELGRRLARPEAGSELLARLVAYEQAYHDAALAITPSAPHRELVGGGEGMYDATADASLGALMTQVSAAGEEASAVNAGLIEYHAALGRYVGLLDRARALLRQTEAAAAAPPDPFSIVRRSSVLRTGLGSDATGTREAILRALSALPRP